MKKYTLIVLLSFGQLFSITPEKCGDYINLAVCVVPYLVALIDYQKWKSEKSDLVVNNLAEIILESSKVYEDDKHYTNDIIAFQPSYRLIGFGKYGSEMMAYLVAMFFSQKYLWDVGTQYIGQIYPNLSDPSSYGVYSMLGATIGLISATIGVICSKGMKAVTSKYIFEEKKS